MKVDNITHDIFGDEIHFEGNTNLKKCKTQMALTKDHVLELKKCANDIFYFAENYYKILSLKYGMITPKLRDYQIEMLNLYMNNRFSIVLATRQAGKSTSFEIYVCWLILFHKAQRVAVLANKAEQSRDILRKVKEAYELLPHWMTQGIKTWNAGSIKLENGSMVIASSTSSTAIRGKSISTLIVDERAFIPNNNWNAFISSVYPTISSSDTSKVIYVSTFNGLNHFYQDWDDAVKGKSEFVPLRVDWWQVPLEGSSTGFRDEAWKEETINNIGMQRFRQEFANEALGSITTLIEPECIANLKHASPLKNPAIYKKMSAKLQDCCKVYYEPIAGHQYVIGVDSAKMTEDNAGDALGMQVIDITSFPLKQVCTFFAKEGVSYLQSPEIVNMLGLWYNTAILFIENNEIGQEVANMIHYDIEYENVYFEKPTLAGFRTTKKTKRVGCSNMKILIENLKIEINDFDTIAQLSTFIRKKTSYCAEQGYQDDLVMSLIAGLFFLQTSGLDIEIVENNTDLGHKILCQTQVIKDEDEMPVMFLPEDEYENKPVNDFDWL